MAYTNRRCHFIKRPQGMPGDDCFEWRDETIPALDEGEFLIENEYFSFEASMRTWMNDGPNYMPPLQIGEVMRGPTMGVVVASRNPDFPEGVRVMGMHGWERFSVACSGPFEQIIPDVPGVSPTIFMGVLGLVGMTAYFGITDICRPSVGQTLLVSGAAGAVGSVAAQLGKIHGARVVGGGQRAAAPQALGQRVGAVAERFGGLPDPLLRVRAHAAAITEREGGRGGGNSGKFGDVADRGHQKSYGCGGVYGRSFNPPSTPF